jgi:predicted PurR-regulated permease PerM
MATPHKTAPRPLLLIVILVSIILLMAFGGVLKLFMLCLLLAYILDPVVTMIEARGMNRTAATVIFMGALGTGLAFLVRGLQPVFFEQVAMLQSGEGSQRTGDIIRGIDQFVRNNFSSLGFESFSLGERLQELRLGLVERTPEFLISDLVGIVLDLVIMPFIIFFLLKDGREIKKEIIGLVPNRFFEFSMDLLYKMDMQLGNYLRSQFIDAVVFGAMTTVALWILDVKYFLFVGAFAGFANLIPYIGPAAGTVLAVAVSLFYSGDPGQAFSVVVAFIILKIIDDVIVQPAVVARGVQLHPLAVLLAIIIGGHMFGILGMLFAVPAAGFLKVVVQESVVTFRRYRFT